MTRSSPTPRSRPRTDAGTQQHPEVAPETEAVHRAAISLPRRARRSAPPCSEAVARRRKPPRRQRGHGRAADDRGLQRAAGPGDPLAEQRPEAEPGRDREQLQAGRDGGRAAHELEVERQVDGARGHPQSGRELQQGDGPEGRVAQQPGREERLAGASLPPAERGRRRQAEPRAPEDLDRCPGELMAAPLADREQAGRRHRQQAGARQLEALRPGRPGQPQAQRHDRERGHADRHVDEEDPAPARGVGDQPAEQRAARPGRAPAGPPRSRCRRWRRPRRGRPGRPTGGR